MCIHLHVYVGRMIAARISYTGSFPIFNKKILLQSRLSSVSWCHFEHTREQALISMSVINIANIILLRIYFTIIILMNILLTEVNSKEKVGVPQKLVLQSSNRTNTGASMIPLLIQCSRQSGYNFNTQISIKGTALNMLIFLKICLKKFPCILQHRA